MSRLLLLAGMATLAACGGSASSQPDGPIGCSVSVSLSPPIPVAPTMLRAQAVVQGAIGFPQVTWQAIGPGGTTLSVQMTTVFDVTFTAAVPGIYMVDVGAMDSGRVCISGSAMVNVKSVSAVPGKIRLRVTPLPDQPAPPQADQIVDIVGGADFTLPGTVVLAAGTEIAGQLTGPAGPLPAYLRLDADRPAFAELFADAQGHYGGFLPSRSFQVLIVPLGADVAPALQTATLSQLGAGLVLDAGDPVNGAVHDAAGQPLAGARVVLGAGSLPPLVVESGADGSFAAHVRAAGGPLAMTVLPSASPLRLELAATAGAAVTAGSTIIATLPTVDLVTFTPRAVNPGGAALPGAIVTFVDEGGLPAGVITVDGTDHPAAAAVRASYVADAEGSFPAITLPNGNYHVVVDPGLAAGLTLGSLDVSLAAPPATLAAAAPAATQILVRRAGGTPANGAPIVAVAAGIYGVGVGMTVGATADANGSAMLPLAPGGTYSIFVEPAPLQPIVRARAVTSGGAAPMTVTLPTPMEISGTVKFPSGAALAGVRVEAFCADCTGPAADVAYDETTTDADGRFSLRVPDPGSVSP